MLLKRLSKYYFLIFLLLSKTDYIIKDVKYLKLSNSIVVTPRISNDLNLIIPKIDLDVYTTYNNTLKEGLEIHKLSTKPGDKNSTIIIMGHAGIGQNVYFNRLNLVEEKDIVYLDYSNIEYKYIVENKEIINKGTMYNFEFNNNNLYLITCYHHNKQIILKAKMAKN